MWEIWNCVYQYSLNFIRPTILNLLLCNQSQSPTQCYCSHNLLLFSPSPCNRLRMQVSLVKIDLWDVHCLLFQRLKLSVDFFSLEVNTSHIKKMSAQNASSWCSVMWNLIFTLFHRLFLRVERDIEQLHYNEFTFAKLLSFYWNF